MAKLAIKKASTDVTTYVFIQDSSKTTGEGLAGLAYNTGSLVGYYVRPKGSATAITLATQTVTGAHSDGGFVEIDATNMPGVYRLDLPDAVCATGVPSVVVMLKGATNMSPVVLEIQLTDFDLNTAGVTLASSQPAITWGQQKIIADADGEGALDIVNTGIGGGGVGIHTEGQFAGQLNEGTGGSSNGTYNIGIAYGLQNYGATGQYNYGSDYGARNYGSIQDVLGYDPAIATASNLQTVDDNVDSILADTGTDGVVLKAAGLNADAVAEIQSGLALEATLTAIKGAGWTNQTLVKIVTDIAAISAGSGATPKQIWEYATRTLTAGTNIDLSALATATDLATVDTVVDAIKAKTDKLPASPAAVGSAMTLTAAYDKAKDDVLTPLAVVDGIVDAIKAQTDKIPATPASSGEYTSALTAIQNDLDNPNQYKADVSNLALQATSLAIKGQTDKIPAAPAQTGEYNAALTAIQADLDNPDQYKADVSGLATAAALTTVDNEVGVIDGIVDAIKAKTDNLPANTTTTLAAIQSDLDNPAQYKADVSGLATTAHVQEVENKIDAIDITVNTIPTNPLLAANYTAPDNASIAAILEDTGTTIPATITTIDNEIAVIDGNVDAILDDTGTSGVLLSTSALTSIFDDEVIVGSYNFSDLLKIMASALAGKLSGGGTTTLTFRGVDDTSDVIVTTVDANKNRTNVVITV